VLALFIQNVPQTQLPASPSQFQVRDLIEIAAIFLGPIVALLLQGQLDKWREIRRQKLSLYTTLMRLRAVRLTPEYVNALNTIDVVFRKKNESERDIRAKWLKLMDHYYVDPNSAGWEDRITDLTIDLLDAMGKSLGYEFDPGHLKRNVYSPRVQAIQFNEQEELRKRLLEVFSGRRNIRVALFKEDFPETK
jgi:hypothetical protein